MTRRILIVTFSYAPMSNARAFRWTALAEAWARQGHQVAVVCAWLPGTPRRERRNGVDVYRAGAGLIERFRAKLARRRTTGAGPAEEYWDRPRRSMGTSIAKFLNERIWHNLYWPDTACVWYFPALSAARAVARSLQPDAIVSVSPAFTAVAVARRLVREIGKGSVRPQRWLIDLGDPFSFAEEAPPNNFRLYRALNTRFERAVFAAADAVAVTTAETAERYAALFPESASRIRVIPPLVSLPEPASDAPDDARHRIRLVYVGTLYRSIRGPDFLLALFGRLIEGPLGERLELHVYGDVRDCRVSFERHAPRLGSRVVLHGLVPHATAVRAMRRAAVLVNLGNRTSYQLPSKVVEYAALGKPILNIAAVPNDSSSRLLEDYPQALTLVADHGDPDGAQVARCEEFLRKASKGDRVAVSRDWLEQFSLSRVSEQYLALLA
jgi:glycosyltransferase involved in cell wall biosynthesis